MPGPSSSTRDHGLVALAAQGHAHLAARLARTSGRCRSGCGTPGSAVPRGPCTVTASPSSARRSARAGRRLGRAWPRRGRRSRAAARPASSGRGGSRDSSASSREALEMSVISRSSRLTSCFRMPSSRVARRLVLDQLQRLHRRADRGQRVADLVGDVGGEALDRLHAVRQGVGHVLQRAGEVAELVVARGDVRQGDGPGAREPHAVGRPRPAAAPAGRSAASAANEETRVDRTAMRMKGTSAAPLGGDDLVDVAGLQRQHAQHRRGRAGSGSRPTTTRPPFSAGRMPPTVSPLERAWRSRASGPARLPGRRAAAPALRQARDAKRCAPGLRAGGSGRRLHAVGGDVGVGDQLARRRRTAAPAASSG